jgi:hypothetical protein
MVKASDVLGPQLPLNRCICTAETQRSLNEAHARQGGSVFVNRLTKSLADVCTHNLLAEKWLIAPSRRVGHQWLEAVTRSGTPVVNVHVKTLTSIHLAIPCHPVVRTDASLSGYRWGIERKARFLQRELAGACAVDRRRFLLAFD